MAVRPISIAQRLLPIARLTQTGCNRHEQRAGDTRREGGGRDHPDRHVDRRPSPGVKTWPAFDTPQML